MSRAPNIRLITDQAPHEQPVATIIVTTDPEPFVSRFAAELGATVHVFDNSKAVLDALNAIRCDRVFADYRQLNDRWTGLRLLRHVRDRPELAHIEVFLMAAEWQATQEVSTVRAGGAGMVRRTPDALARRILTAAPLPSQAPGAHAEAFEPLPAAPAIASPPPSGFAPSDRVADAWTEAVNVVFKRYAGALGARLMISAAVAAVEAAATKSRGAYVTDLAGRLATPDRRTEFLDALRAAGLVR